MCRGRTGHLHAQFAHFQQSAMNIQQQMGAQQMDFERVAPYKVSRHRNSLPEIHEIGRVEVMHCGAATEDGKPVQGQVISTPSETSANPPACSLAGHTPESC